MQEGKFELYGIAAGVRGHSLTHTPAVSHMEWMLFMQKDFLYSFIRVCASLGDIGKWVTAVTAAKTRIYWAV